MAEVWGQSEERCGWGLIHVAGLMPYCVLGLCWVLRGHSGELAAQPPPELSTGAKNGSQLTHSLIR